MLTITKTANLTGQSKSGDVVLAFLNATIQSVSGVTMGRTIPNLELYLANQTEVDADIKAFQDEVFATASNSGTVA